MPTPGHWEGYEVIAVQSGGLVAARTRMDYYNQPSEKGVK